MPDKPDIPSTADLLRIARAIAMLDAVLCDEWEYRYYSFNAHWSADDSSEMTASMRDGSGDEYFIWFSAVGVAIKGFAHESWLSPANNNDEPFPGVLDDVPAEFANFLNEPAFALKNTTFCFWRGASDSVWHSGNVDLPPEAGADPGGACKLLAIFDGKPATYAEFASSYYELEVDEEDVACLYDLKPLTADLLERLGCNRELNELRADAAEIGYPIA